MYKEFGRFLMSIIPPAHGSVSQVTSWRYRMAMCQIASSVSAALSWLVLAIAFGFVGSMGFATGSDVTTLDQRLRSIEIRQIEQQIVSTVDRKCMAKAEGNESTARLLERRLSELTDDYLALTGRGYRVPEC